jgi:hypothetical protein
LILRRVIQHFRKQEWTAIAIDFVIVVFGVFIGIQVANWNDSRKNADDYQLALARLVEEAKGNLEALDEIETSLDSRLTAAKVAFDVLLSCNTETESETLVNSGLNAIRGTVGLKLQHIALDEITQSKAFLAQQSSRLRKNFTDISARIALLESEARFAENLPFTQRMQDNPIIAIGPEIDKKKTIVGSQFPVMQRSLVISVAISEACKNDNLLKSFYTWEYWQSRQRSLAYDMRQEVESLIQLVGSK